MKRLILAAGITTALVAGSAQAATYVVQAKGLDFDKALARQMEAAGGQVVARLPQIGVAIVEADASFGGRAERMSEIEYATVDRILQFDLPGGKTLSYAEAAAASPPNTNDDDFFFDLQWGHDAVDAPEAWQNGNLGAGARVAVLDSGIDCSHPDLTPNLVLALNASFVPGEGACTVLSGFNHGTHVAGTIAAADNAFGTIGVAPEAEIFAVKVLSESTGSGSFGGILQGILYAADNGADVINMSLGVQGGLPVIPQTRELIKAVQRAVLYARKQNAIVIASAGNDAIDYDNAFDPFGNELMSFPGGVHGVVAVSATAPIGWALDPSTNLDIPTSYTNYGKHLIQLAGPGGDSVYPGNEFCAVAGLVRPCWVFDLVFSTSAGGWAWAGGTSMAAPHVAGVAALIVAANGGELSVGRIENGLIRGAEDLGDRGNDEFFGRGRVNADQSTTKHGGHGRSSLHRGR